MLVGRMVDYKIPQVSCASLDLALCSVEEEGQELLDLLLVLGGEVVDFHVALDQRKHAYIAEFGLSFENFIDVQLVKLIFDL